MQDKLSEQFSRALFASAAPLSMFESANWKIFFNNLRPDFQIPSRYVLSNTLLDNEYKRITIITNEYMKKSSTISIICDGWTNVRNDSIVNFVITTPKPIFHKSLPTVDEHHTGEYMSKIIGEVIEEVGPSKVLGLCTDNAPNMVKAWNILREKYSIECYGCLAHGLNLIFTDIKKLSSFETKLKEVVSIVNSINGSCINLANFKKFQSTNSTTLKLPVATRWSSTVISLKSLINNELSLKEYAIRIDDNKMKTTKNKLLSDVFWDQTKGLYKLLEPISDAIKILETDKPIISESYMLYFNIIENTNDILNSSPISKSDESKFKEIIYKRKYFSIKLIHKAAYLLDPKYKGANLQSNEKVCIYL